MAARQAPRTLRNSLVTASYERLMDGAKADLVITDPPYNVVIDGLETFGSVTYVDSRILRDSTFVSTIGGTTAEGKPVPNIPAWRVTAGATYRPNAYWAFTAAMRYSSKQYSTLDNTDIVSHVFGAFDDFFVVDMKVHYNATKNFSFDFGIDNLFNEQYFLFHPFPGRTFVLAAKYTL